MNEDPIRIPSFGGAAPVAAQVLPVPRPPSPVSKQALNPDPSRSTSLEGDFMVVSRVVVGTQHHFGTGFSESSARGFTFLIREGVRRTGATRMSAPKLTIETPFVNAAAGEAFCELLEHLPEVALAHFSDAPRLVPRRGTETSVIRLEFQGLELVARSRAATLAGSPQQLICLECDAELAGNGAGGVHCVAVVSSSFFGAGILPAPFAWGDLETGLRIAFTFPPRGGKAGEFSRT
jgi:hypothetical protein